MKVLLITLYLLAIAAANVLTANNPPLHFGSLTVPVGTFLIGATFVLRDFVQNAVGRRNTYLTIAVAMALSAVMSIWNHDAYIIVIASAVSFLFSETSDTEIYTRMKSSMPVKVLMSGLVGGTLDSAIFVIIGLSPLGANFIPWDGVISAILGQTIVKGLLQIIGVSFLLLYRGKRVTTSA